MKPRRNTADSEPEPGSSQTFASSSAAASASASASAKPNTLKKSKGNSLEMNAWPRRYTPLQSNAPDTPSAAQLKPLELRPQSQLQFHSHSQSQPQTPLSPHSQYYQQYQQNQGHHDSWRGSQSTFQPPPSHRASTTSSHDGNGKRTSRRGSRNSRNSRTPATPTHIPVVDFATDFSTDFDGQDMFYPLSPAPVKKPEAAKGPRTTRGDDSEILPPDDRNYPVPPYRTASSSTLVSQTQRNSLNKKHSQSGVAVPAPTAAPLRIIHTSPTGPPSIYWSDDNASQAGTDSATIRTTATATNPSAFTFYREPDDESDGEDDTDARRQNRASRRFSRLSRITSSTVAREERGDKDKSEKRRSLRDIGLAVSRGLKEFKDPEKEKEPEKVVCTGGRCDLDELSSDDELEDGVDADGRRLEGRQTAEFEFVNGRYVPPALRNGRAPGRKPVNETRELERERERKRKMNMSGALGVGMTSSAASPDPEMSLGGDGDAEREVYYDSGGRSAPSFWFVAGMIVFFIVAIAVGVGVGVGLSMSHS